MTTARQKADATRRLRRELEQDRRARDRAALKKLRVNLRHARQHKSHRLREIVVSCRQAVEMLRERANAIRAEARAKANAEILTLRAQSRSRCELDKTRVRERGANAVQRALARVDAEQKHVRFMALHTKPPKLRSAPRHRTADAIHESDSEVANNVPDNLLPVWRAVKSRIKGTPRRSRTEAFLEWAAEHKGEVLHIMDRHHEADIAELVKQESELRARVRSPRAYRRMSEAQLADVPF